MENSYIENSENCAAKEPFALRVQDSSMEPEFENGCIIIIDPSISPKTGDFVLFEKKDTIILREIHILDENIELKPLNPEFSSEIIKDKDYKTHIIGVVTQRAGKKGHIIRNTDKKKAR